MPLYTHKQNQTTLIDISGIQSPDGSRLYILQLKAGIALIDIGGKRISYKFPELVWSHRIYAEVAYDVLSIHGNVTADGSTKYVKVVIDLNQKSNSANNGVIETMDWEAHKSILTKEGKIESFLKQ